MERKIINSNNHLFLKESILSKIESVNDVLQLFSNELSEFINVIDSTIYFFNSNNRIIYDNAFNQTTLLEEKIKYLEEQGIIDWIITKKENVLLDDPDEKLKNQNFKLIIIPVFVKAALLSLYVLRIIEKKFELDSINDLLSNFAFQISVLIDYKIKKEEIILLKKKVTELNEKLLNIVLANSFPDINENLTSEIDASLKIISGNIDLIESGIGDIEQRTEIVKKNLNHINKINKKLKELNSSANRNNSIINIAMFIKDCIELCKTDLKKKDIEITDLTNLNKYQFFEVNASETELEKVLLIILTNYKEILPEGGKISVNLNLEKERLLIVDLIAAVPYINYSPTNNFTVFKQEPNSLFFEDDKMIFIKQTLKRIKSRMDIIKDDDKGFTIKLYFPIFKRKKERNAGND